MFPTPKASSPVNNDAGISGEVTFSQTPGVPVACGSETSLPASFVPPALAPAPPAPRLPSADCILLLQPAKSATAIEAQARTRSVHTSGLPVKETRLRILHGRSYGDGCHAVSLERNRVGDLRTSDAHTAPGTGRCTISFDRRTVTRKYCGRGWDRWSTAHRCETPRRFVMTKPLRACSSILATLLVLGA